MTGCLRVPLRTVLLAACLLLATAGLARANQLITITIPDAHGEIPAQWLNYYKGPPRANVLLPDGYDPSKRYPLLVFLHGLGGDYASYAYGGDLTVFKGFHGIVVMPEDADGWYADWWNGGTRSPSWESYQLNEVIPYIVSHFPILAGRQYHALAGISMGGLGAAYLGERLPGFFGSVASLSGFDDPQYFAPIAGEGMAALSNTFQNGDYNLYPIYGPPYGYYATGHNPAANAANLKQTRVFVSSGNGEPASEEELTPSTVVTSCVNPGAGNCYTGDWVSEGTIIYPMSQLFHNALVKAGVDVTWQVQNGGHTDPHFRVELRNMLAWGLFKPVPEHPASWVNTTVATDGQLWDIGYRFTRPPDRVVRFRRAGSWLSVGEADSAVTLTTTTGCTITVETPVRIQVPAAGCDASTAGGWS